VDAASSPNRVLEAVVTWRPKPARASASLAPPWAQFAAGLRQAHRDIGGRPPPGEAAVRPYPSVPCSDSPVSIEAPAIAHRPSERNGGLPRRPYHGPHPSISRFVFWACPGFPRALRPTAHGPTRSSTARAPVVVDRPYPSAGSARPAVPDVTGSVCKK